MTHLRHLLALAALSATVTTAQSAIVTFNDLATLNPQGVVFDDFDEGGFHFSNDCGDFCFGVWATYSPYQADPGGASVFVNYGNSVTTMSRVDGSSFDLRSIDFADVFNLGRVQQVVFSFQYASGGHDVLTRWIKDRAPGLETVTLGLSGLSSISWVTAANANPKGSGSQFDNIVYSIGAVNAVPEPETCALLLAGLGAVALRRRAARK